MKVALCHNFYQIPGGEDKVFRDEGRLLEERGHEVLRFTKHNDEIDSLGRFNLIGKTFWNYETERELEGLLGEFQPDVVHFTNTFPLISPSAYRAASQAGAAVIQSLHNFRFVCPAANLMHDHQVCERCLKKSFAWPSISRRCYRDSLAATGVVAAANFWHRIRKTRERYIDRFITLTDFCRSKFIEAGFDVQRIRVKPNFVFESESNNGLKSDSVKQKRGIFAGRLSPEKGIEVLLRAWKSIDVPLDVVGDGPLMPMVRQAAEQNPLIQVHGQLPQDQLFDLINRAWFQVVPSTSYETFGLVAIEAFSRKTPVIASRIGSLSELITHPENGLLFDPGDTSDLIAQIRRLTTDNVLSERLAQNGFENYRDRYTPDVNYRQLMNIYNEARTDKLAAVDS